MVQPPPYDGPPIPIQRVLLLPLGLIGGFFVGAVVGAVYLPYLVLSELIRKLGQSFPYFAGWTEWAESAGRKVEPRRGWLLVWMLWMFCYVGSVLTWAWVVGMVTGPFVGAWLCIAPDGLDRLLARGREIRERFRRLRIRIVADEDRDAA